MKQSLPFFKFHGTGNDFILVDERTVDHGLDTAMIALLCHRRFSIGADGLISLRSSSEADFRMVYFNADGREGSMCGNGGRCIVAFARALGLIGETTRFMGVDGLHEASISAGSPPVVRLRMSDVLLPELRDGYDFIDTGSPHVVVPTGDLERFPVVEQGRAIRHRAAFAPGGTNVNFVRCEEDRLHVRTYERGVEDETMSCGTGVTAAVLTAATRGWIPADSGECRVQTPGGGLSVSFRRTTTGFTDIWLTGPAVMVFQGHYPLHG
jgi:diaminopimelate epimerase